MAFDIQYGLARTEAFQNRVQIALASVALGIATEAKGAQTQIMWDKRTALANAVLASPDQQVARFCVALVTNAGATAAATDAQIVTAITNMWNAMAGARVGE
jgi:hypothetical protein